MQLIVQDEDGTPVSSHSDYSLDLQYGDDECDFVLYIPNCILQAKQRVLCDGTSFAGVIDRRCPSSTANDGDSITYKGRTPQGVLKKKVIQPDAGNSHLTVSGDANDIIALVISRLGLDEYFAVPDKDSGLYVQSYSFNRYVDGWTGLRMMLATVGGRLQITCHDGLFDIEAVAASRYGDMASEQVYFSMDVDYLPVNHLIGLGKGEGAARAVSHWYADSKGNVSQTQTLFGLDENCEAYNLNSEEDSELASKTKSKLRDYQLSSEADLTLPPSVRLDVGDRVVLSNSKYGITREVEVVQVVLKAYEGIADVSYKFGYPDYPKDEE